MSRIEQKDPEIRDIFNYAESGKLPADDVNLADSY